jgi:hypothetical protein
MGAKLHEMEHFFSVEQMDRAFGDTAGQIAAMHLGFSAKKPDKSKVKDLLEKGKKEPATFYLVLDGLKLTFELRVGTGKLVLNTLDMAGVKDLSKRRELLFQLSMRAQELVSKNDLKKFDEEHTEAENPAVQKAAVELGSEIDELENQLDNLKIMQTSANYKGTNYSSYDKEFKDWVQKKGLGRFVAFVDDAEGKGGLGTEALKLLADPKTSGIQPKTLEAIKAAEEKGGALDFSQARKEVIANIINKLLLPRYNKERVAEITKEINDKTTKLAALKKKLQALETK